MRSCLILNPSEPFSFYRQIFKIIILSQLPIDMITPCV